MCSISYLMTMGLSFMGLSYIIIYVGAVSILFLFILMLIDIRISELQNDTNNSIILYIIIGIYLYFILFILLSYHQIKLNNNNYNLFDLFINIYLSLYFDSPTPSVKDEVGYRLESNILSLSPIIVPPLGGPLGGGR